MLIVVDMYLYAVGTNITELEMAGHYPEKDVENSNVASEMALKTAPATYQVIEQEIGRAAEPEEQR